MATPTSASQIAGLTSVRDPILQKCRDYYKVSVEAYRDTHLEGQEIIDMYHNRQYTQAQLQKLREQGQPAETFNIIKLFTNAIIGYLETVVSTIQAVPRYPSESVLANIVNDVIQATLDDNDWTSNERFIKIDGLLTGLMCAYEEVVDTGVKDEFGRPIYNIKLSHVPSYEVRIDPQSRLEDYSDARFIHHFKWVPESALRKQFSKKKVDQLIEYYNFLDSDERADWFKANNIEENGEYRKYDNYLVVKSIVEHNGKIYSVIWSDWTILEKKEITFKEVRFPYRVVKMSKSDRTEYYGPFRDVAETQKAINQALLQIQLLVNTDRVFVEDGAIENLEEFRQLYARVNSIIPVVSLQGIKVENMSADIVNQYQIIDAALQRIKMVLGINDSFLGTAYASDSGRKVKIQQMASAAQLTNVVDRVGGMFRFIGQDIFKLIRQYYQAHQILRVSDPLNKYHFTEMNAPIQMPTGQIDPQTGMPIVQPVMEPEIDPDTGDVMRDEDGNIIMVPMIDPDTKLEYADADIKIIAVKSDNSQEQNQVLLQQFVGSPMGQALLQLNPAAYLKAAAMMISEMGTKHSIEIARLLIETAMGIEHGKIDPRLAMYGGDIQKILGGTSGGSTGNPQNTPGGMGAPGVANMLGGNPGNIPQVGREGGSPGNIQGGQ